MEEEIREIENTKLSKQEADKIEKHRKAEEKAKKKLEKKVEKTEKKAISLWAEFKKFIAKGNVVDLAVAIIVGAAFNKVVNTLVSSVITPLTSMLIPSGDDYTKLKWVLRAGIEADETAGIAAVPEVAVTYGLFIEALVNFLIISLTLFFAIRSYLKIKELLHRKELEAARQRAAEAEKRKKAEAEAEAERLEKIKQDFIEDVAAQADELREIKEIMLRMERKNK